MNNKCHCCKEKSKPLTFIKHTVLCESCKNNCLPKISKNPDYVCVISCADCGTMEGNIYPCAAAMHIYFCDVCWENRYKCCDKNSNNK